MPEAQQAENDFSHSNNALPFSPSSFDPRSEWTDNMYSFDNQHAGLNDLLNFDDDHGSPCLPSSELFYDQSRPMHVNPAAMWNSSGPNDIPAEYGSAASPSFSTMGKSLNNNLNSKFSQNFGQITPPSDSCIPDGKPESKRADSGVNVVGLDIPSQSVPHSSFKSPKSSRSRTTSSGARPSKRARTNSQRTPDAASKEDGTPDFEGPAGDSKREKYREKNRVAAAKCRAKKKGHVDNLEDTHRTQSVLNTALKQTEKTLRDELSFWRTQALQHTFCSCHAIQQYNMRKAQNIAAESKLGSGPTHGSPGMMSNGSAAPSPESKACLVHPGRSQSMSEPKPVIGSPESKPRQKSFASPGDFSSFQTTFDGTDNHVWNNPSSSGRHLTMSDEQELKNFVNETMV